MFQVERKKASFDKAELSYLIYGGKQAYQKYLMYQSTFDNDPQLKFDPSFLHQSRHQMMDTMANKILRFHSYHHLFPLNSSSSVNKAHFMTYWGPLALHQLMYLTTLDNLCDQQQRKTFYQPSLKGQILGCYAQTELGHGSDVQRLETTATYNKANQTFTINTPTVSAAKWWIGDLGMHCTHAALFAQLIIDNKSYGIHCFVVPIRDPKTFKTLPGVEAGDIGPKQGFTTKDNGYAIFNNTVIPRKNMLMKYHVVSKQGKYSVQGNQKISYATMLMTRSAITETTARQMAKITTIATRYSILRKQFKNKQNVEIPILDYQTQQAKVISRIGEVYAFFFTSKNIAELSKQVYQQAKKNNFDRLNEAHVLTSAGKAYMTWEANNKAEVARRSAGGHGFHLYNGMIGTQLQLSPALTYQGQFTILMLQVARFLFKSWNSLQKGKPLDLSIKYLEKLKKGNLSIEVKTEDSLNCPYFVHQILTNFACVSVKNMGLKIQQGVKQGLSEKQVWDTYAGLVLVDAAIAHSIVTIHSFFVKESQAVKCPKLKAVLTKLCLLYGLQKILQRSSRVYQTGILAPQAFQLINKRREELLEQLRPQALTLVQAFGYSDNVLQSAIAHSNQRPYENLINWARNYNTVNRPQQRKQIIEAIKKAKSQLKPAL